MNVLINIFDNKPMHETIVSIIPFIVLIIVNLVLKTNDLPNYITYIVLGVACLVGGSPDNLIGVFFLLTSIDKRITKKNVGTIIIIFTTSLIIKFYMQGFNFAQSTGFFLGCIYVVYVYYTRVNPLTKKTPTRIKTNIDTIGITQEEKAILKLYCRGYDYNKIQHTLSLNIAPTTVRRKIKAIKDKYRKRITGSDDKKVQINDAQFGKWLFESV